MTSPSSILARLVVTALDRAGVRHVVLCPGSRSAPLAYALDAVAGCWSDDAGRRPLAVHVRHDERVAAFTALGVSAAGTAAGLTDPDLGAVVTTSGTAVANLHPAVLEAHHRNVPLVVVTADRPPELRGTWANQTSELQAELFGRAVRARIDLDDVRAAADPEDARTRLAEVLAAARGGAGRRPGPVHLNLGFSEPLLPGDGPPDPADALPVPVGGPVVGGPVVGGADVGGSGGPLGGGPPTVVVAGDGAGAVARILAERGGWPLLAEPSSGARAGRNAVGPYRLLLELPELAAAVRRVVVVGRPTLSRPVSRLLARPDLDVVLVSPWPEWPDPGRPVRRLPPDLALTLLDLPGRPDAPWLGAWLRAGRVATRAVDAVLAAEPGLTGPSVAREVAAALTPTDRLVVSASNAVRDLDLAARPFPVAGSTAVPMVLANRGLAGIDGTLATATGVALAASGDSSGTVRDRPVVRVLTGDLAFLHDLNALLPGPDPEPNPAAPPADLQIVVLNDGGGGIFSLLEHGDRADRGPGPAATFERVFGTPHTADLAALCQGYRVSYRRVADPAALRTALAAPPAGRSVVEVRLRRDRLRDLHSRIRQAVRDAVREAVADAVGAAVATG